MEKKKALVIHDEQTVLDSVGNTLRDENYEVNVSLRGLDWAEGRKYDIVLTDTRMPDIGACYTAARSAGHAMRLGIAGYIEKLFEPEELLDATVSALGKAITKEAEEQN